MKTYKIKYIKTLAKHKIIKADSESEAKEIFKKIDLCNYGCVFDVVELQKNNK